MKKLPLHNPSYRYLEKSFREWLDILGYAESTVYSLPLHIRELLHYLEQRGIKNINQLTQQHITNHYDHLRSRSNQRRGGALSSNHLNKHLQAIRKFTEYLRQAGRMELPDIELNNEQLEARDIQYLTEQEVQQLYKSTHKPYRQNKARYDHFIDALKSRDRVMLSILYGCGARRNEAVNINVSDINFDRKTLHIKKGKRYKERLVPIGRQALQHLQEWIYDYRGLWVRTPQSEALFISERGQRLGGASMLLRLKMLQHLTEDPTIIEKEIGLHTLRHSIATHLLHNGMKLESISRFLGHSSLESTQIYTHLKKEDDI